MQERLFAGYDQTPAMKPVTLPEPPETMRQTGPSGLKAPAPPGLPGAGKPIPGKPASGKPIAGKPSQAVLNRAMTISTAAGAMGTMWVHVCSPQPIFNVFLVNFLGASSATLGLLIGIMQASAVLQLLSVFIYARLPSRKLFWILLHLAHRAAGIVVMLAAFSVAGGAGRESAIPWIVAAVAISWSLMNISSSGWLSWMADLIPERVRGRFFLRRSSVCQAVTVVWFFLITLMLDLFPDSKALVYGIVIGIGAIAGIIDIAMHFAIPEPETQPGRDPVKAENVFASFLSPLRDRNFVRYSISIGAAVFAINLVGPFLSPYITSPTGLGAPNTWLGIMTVISQLVWVAAAPFWGVIMDRYGRKPAVILGCLTTAGWIGYFFMTDTNYIFILPVIALVGGFFGPAFWEGAGQLMLTLTPGTGRVTYIAWYNTIVGLVSAMAPILGGELRDLLGSFSYEIGPISLRGFHLVLLLSLFLVGFAMMLINRTGEGRKKRLGDVATELVGGTLFRSFMSLDALNRVQDSSRVASALRRIEDASGELLLDEVLGRLEDPSPEVRSEAARALGRIGAPIALDALVKALSDPESTIRLEAARSLGMIGDKSAIPALAGGLSSPWPELRAACAEALGAIGDDASINILLEAFRSERTDSVLVMGTEAASRSGEGEGDSETRFEIFQAVWELFPRFVATPNMVLRRQYAIAMANLLGKPGEFYQYITGGELERDARLKTLYSRFEESARELIDGPKARHKPESMNEEQHRTALGVVFTRLQAAVDVRDWNSALSDFLSISQAIMDSLVGEVAHDSDTFRQLVALDLRLATWWWIGRETMKLSAEIDPESKRTILELGMYFWQRQ